MSVTTNNILFASGLKKSFKIGRNKLDVLKDVEINIKNGELVALMGPSGSGKSTLLNIIGGLLKADDGYIELSDYRYGIDNPIHLNELRRERNGWIFQNSNLLQHLSVEDNIALALTISGFSLKEAQEKSLMALDKLGLSERVGFYPGQLSGGQNQRVAIARAISGNRTLLLADEPTGNLDTNTGEEKIKLFQELCHDPSNTFSVLMVTHDPILASKADRILLLKDGRVVKSDQSGNQPDDI